MADRDEGGRGITNKLITYETSLLALLGVSSLTHTLKAELPRSLLRLPQLEIRKLLDSGKAAPLENFWSEDEREESANMLEQRSVGLEFKRDNKIERISATLDARHYWTNSFWRSWVAQPDLGRSGESPRGPERRGK